MGYTVYQYFMRIKTVHCFLFLLFVSFHVSLKGFSQLRQVYLDSDPDNEISKVSFYSPSQGYVAFSKWVGFTTDSGRTFTKKFITPTNVDFNNNTVNITFGLGINGIKAFNQNDIVVYGDYGLVPSILVSGDGGNTFKLVYHSQFDPLQLKTGVMDMVFPQNGNTGYAVDADRILKTVNRGLTWTPVFSSGQYFTTIDAVDDNTVFAITPLYNRIWKSTNGGSTWGVTSLIPGQLKHSHFITGSKGWANVENSVGGAVYYTSNGGINWTLKNNPALTSLAAEKLKFINDSTGFALVDYFQVYKTSDSGKSVGTCRSRQQFYTPWLFAL